MSGPKRRWLIPEVVQTSAMDCGPASLKCLLEGFGVHVSYGRLREACQTDVDGTSIDTMEEIANQLGLEAEQIMVPLDHLLIADADALPGIIVVRLPTGDTHFVVAWNQVGGLVQVMDPGHGRRWMTRARFLEEVYVHVMPVSAEAFREYAGSDAFLNPLRARIARIGATGFGGMQIARGIDDPTPRTLAVVDAAARMVEALISAGGLERGPNAGRFFNAIVDETLMRPPPPPKELGDPEQGEGEFIPAAYWTVRPAKPDAEGNEQVLLRGAVLVRTRGVRAPGEQPDKEALSPELAAALAEPPATPGRDLIRFLREDGWFTPAALVLAMFLSGMAGIIEALLFRGLFDVSKSLGLFSQRIAAASAVLVFLIAMLMIEVPVAGGMQRLGRHLEARLRIAFLEKIPKLGDRYFQSRPTSDMAQRAHMVQMLRVLPSQGGALVRSVLDLFVTTVGIIWVDPKSWLLAIIVAVLAIVIPLVLGPLLTERDMRVRAHSGSLGRFYLDAFLGLTAIRTHGAERSIRREHESLLAEWTRANFSLQRAAVAMEAAHAVIGFALAGVIMIGFLARSSDPARLMLLLYWSLNLPATGEAIARMARIYPGFRNTTLRLLEPLGALEDAESPNTKASRLSMPAIPMPSPIMAGGPISAARLAALSTLDFGDKEDTVRINYNLGAATIHMQGVKVVAAGHTILEELDFTIAPGEHVAIVGPSGAGKSSLAGLLLGWHRPSEGVLLVDGEPLDGPGLEKLRQATAWVDPAVQLWNRSLLDNLTYGRSEDALTMPRVLEEADLRGVLEKLPDGLQTKLGEGGALVSGGEGQRVRLGRAMHRALARLVILDEPFRGLDRDKRRELLGRARRLWGHATMLCITHDVGETLGFERVIVIENGKVIEDGAPAELGQRPSRYRDLLEAEHALREGMWSSTTWRRIRIEKGQVTGEKRGAERQSAATGEEGERERV